MPQKIESPLGNEGGQRQGDRIFMTQNAKGRHFGKKIKRDWNCGKRKTNTRSWHWDLALKSVENSC